MSKLKVEYIEATEIDKLDQFAATRQKLLEAYLLNFSPVRTGLSNRERKRSHGNLHHHGGVSIYREPSSSDS